MEVSTDIANRHVEIVLVMQANEEEPVGTMGYSVGYFEEIYGMFAVNPLARNQPLHPDTRDIAGY